ncbi:MAG: RHS repeat-associated core domain-containing protein, partial [Lachnospiraceae bacterium]|nr:RHS repeat-associated core domain-containing protein [Lachnospiraceae bacterium]
AFYTLGEDLISMERNGETWYYIYDGHGSVRHLTDSNGTVTDSYSYDAYGNLLEKEGTTENDFFYAGEQYNAGTGLYYLRARYMDPSTGTFISMDSYQGSIYDPVSLHKYLYANANPVMYTDPSGYSAEEQLVATGMNNLLQVAAVTSGAFAFAMGSLILRSLTNLKEDITVTYNYVSIITEIIESGVIVNSTAAVAEKVKDEAKTVAVTGEKEEKRIYTVYTLIDGQGTVRYVGRTKDYPARIKAHKYNKNGKIRLYGLIPGPYISGLTKNEARGLEQTLIVLNHTLNSKKDQSIPYYNYVKGVAINARDRVSYYDDTIKYMNRYPSLFENFVEEELNAIKEDMSAWW